MANQSTPLLQANSLSVTYAKTAVLSGVSVQLVAGQTVGLLGLNGAGKSTMLKVLACNNSSPGADICIDGKPLTQHKYGARELIGFAPDKPPVYPDFTVQQFLQYAASLRRVERAQINQRVAEAIAECELGKHQHRIIGNLSHGCQQRVNLAQAIVHKPKLLLLDEPLNGLDPAQISSLRDRLNAPHPEQAIVYSSHQLAEVQACCDRVIVIHKGRKVLDTELIRSGHTTGANDSEQHPLTVELQLKSHVQAGELQSLPGVQSANSLVPGRWLLTLRNSSIASVRSALQERKLPLTSLEPVKNQLEAVFNHLSLDSLAHNQDALERRPA